jgi:peptide-methionine (S)-S-oxide reductase
MPAPTELHGPITRAAELPLEHAGAILKEMVMKTFFVGRLRKLLGVLPLVALAACSVSDAAVTLPDPAVDTPAAAKGMQTAVFAGGCFWGIEAVFEHIKGVTNAVSGYSGGTADTAKYNVVSSGSTGHAEAVQVTYDPAKVSYGQLLKVFFSVAHNPTELNRQGPDTGPQYRSAIFHVNDEQKRVAQAYIAQLQSAKIFPRPIVTELVPLKAFYAAEDYHQDYVVHHPDQPYIVYNDLPKVASLKKQFPQLYTER